MLEAADLECVRGSRRLFSALSFRVDPGALLWVLGPNGSGKTSLLRLLCGLIRPDKGSVRWHGEDVRGTHEAFCADLLYIGHAVGVKADLSSRENLRYSLAQSGVAANTEDVDGALRGLGLQGYEHTPARALSQGQQRRVALARLSLASTKHLWILDEPFTALDNEAVRIVQLNLAAQIARGGTVVFTSHQEVDLGALSVQRLFLTA